MLYQVKIMVRILQRYLTKEPHFSANPSSVYSGVGSSVKSNTWSRNISLPSAQSLHSISRNDKPSFHMNHGKYIGSHGEASIRHSTQTVTAISRQISSQAEIRTGHTFNRFSLLPGSTQGWNDTNSLVTLQQLGHCKNVPEPNGKAIETSEDVVSIVRNGIPKPTSFANYADAVRLSSTSSSAIATPAPTFKVYEDVINDQREEVSGCTSFAPKTFHTYAQKLHAISSSCNRWSANEAEYLLRDMIDKHKAGYHDFRPDGGCYNRYDESTEIKCKQVRMYYTPNRSLAHFFVIALASYMHMQKSGYHIKPKL
jgi:hypothetical protein